MPHFIIDCSNAVIEQVAEELIREKIHCTVFETGLFIEDEIKIRLNPFTSFSVGNTTQDFIHVFAYIMEGRTVKQKADLSEQVVATLVDLCPNVSNVAMNICDFEKATYCNKTMLCH